MRITFNKFSVLLMYIMIIGFMAVCLIMKEWPPAEFTYCWFAFWIAQAVITAALQINKRKHRYNESLLEAVTPYINQDNAEAIARKLTGVDLKTKKHISDDDFSGKEEEGAQG